MEIINPKNNVEQLVDKPKKIDDDILDQIANITIATKRDNQTDKIYTKLYESKYNVDMKIARKEASLTAKLNILQTQDEELIKTSLQLKEYNWIQILKNKMGEIAYRFYLAPDPSNMYRILDEIVTKFMEEELPAKIKYQQERRFGECDRIVIYVDEAYKDKIEKCLLRIYSDTPQLFADGERALPWLYKSKIPGVYWVPEKPGVSYEQEFVKTIIESKEMFCYLKGITGRKSFFSEEDADYDKGYLKQILASMLLRNGLLISNEGKRIAWTDENISTVYDYKTGELTNSNKGDQIYSEAIFSQTTEGKEALIKNFYNVSKMKTEEGVIVQHLTPEERRMQLYTFFIGGHNN